MFRVYASRTELFMNLTDICCLSQQLVGKLHGNAFSFLLRKLCENAVFCVSIPHIGFSAQRRVNRE